MSHIFLQDTVGGTEVGSIESGFEVEESASDVLDSVENTEDAEDFLRFTLSYGGTLWVRAKAVQAVTEP